MRRPDASRQDDTSVVYFWLLIFPTVLNGHWSAVSHAWTPKLYSVQRYRSKRQSQINKLQL